MILFNINKYSVTSKKSIMIMAITLVLFIVCVSNAQDVVNEVKSIDDVNKAIVAAPAIRKQSVIKSKGSIENVALVRALTRDKDKQVRRNAVKSLARMNAKTPATIKALTRHLNDADPVVRKEAADGLKKIGTPAIQPLTVALMKHKNPVVRRQAAILIGEISRANQKVATNKNTQTSVTNKIVTEEVVKANKKQSESIN